MNKKFLISIVILSLCITTVLSTTSCTKLLDNDSTFPYIEFSSRFKEIMKDEDYFVLNDTSEQLIKWGGYDIQDLDIGSVDLRKAYIATKDSKLKDKREIISLPTPIIKLWEFRNNKIAKEEYENNKEMIKGNNQIISDYSTENYKKLKAKQDNVYTVIIQKENNFIIATVENNIEELDRLLDKLKV